MSLAVSQVPSDPSIPRDAPEGKGGASTESRNLASLCPQPTGSPPPPPQMHPKFLLSWAESDTSMGLLATACFCVTGE